MIQVSPEDEWMLTAYEWRLMSKERYSYACRTHKDVDGKRKTVLMHRQIMGAAKGQIVDHINGDPTDNRRENLRICTHAENMRNRRYTGNKTGFPNVYWEHATTRRNGYYVAEITIDWKRKRKGGFKTPAEAFECAKRLLDQHHGAFAKTRGVESHLLTPEEACHS